MSRVGKNPIPLPAGVEIRADGQEISVTGPLGSLKMVAHPAVSVVREGETVRCEYVEGTENGPAMWGTLRANLSNMVIGVSRGFEKKLTLVGVGYRAQAQDGLLNLTLGFSHPVAYKMPTGVKVETPTQTEIIIRGIDKQQVGQAAAEIRAYRRPEPYKGKGVRYAGEVIALKETKKK
jgi:large subunit ribosomal protein L6